MPTAPLTPDPTPAELSVTKFVTTVKRPHVLLLTPTRPKRVRNVAPVPEPECERTGNDPPDNFLCFQQLTDLSVKLAGMFRHLSLDYIDVATYSSPDTPLARRLLQRDVDKYRKLIATGSDRVQQNTVLRALILFSSCSHHATQYLEHSADSRIAWLTQLNTEGVWIKPLWEKDVAARMVGLIRKNLQDIEMVCPPKAVYSVVYNSYFLMLFARHEYSELSDELRLLGATPYTWHDLPFLRKEYFRLNRARDVAAGNTV
jgi:hypothetical protein